MVICKRSLGIAEDASEGDLARWWLQRGKAVSFGALGSFNLELGPLEEELVAL